MIRRRTFARAPSDALRSGFDAVRAELGVPKQFPQAVLAEGASAARAPKLPDEDLTSLPFLTIDPPGSKDLDQAMLIERRNGGYRVRYAIADVAAFVASGGAIDNESHLRGETLYSPDLRTPLHPPVLAEGAASLLPGQPRPAVVWNIDLDADGEPVKVHVGRALVRSHDRFDYEGVQAKLDAESTDERLLLLREVGELRQQRERDRGGVSLNAPDQEVVRLDGGWTLKFRAPLPCEGWNAQISLLTGMSAAKLMIEGRVGVLRTMPPPADSEVQRLRLAAAGLGIDWPITMTYAALLQRLNPRFPTHAAFLNEATVLFRGASYRAFDGTVPLMTTHSAVAGPYAHVTAPIRRLVDRFGSEICLAVCAGAEVPEWVRAALPALPNEMTSAAQKGNALERGCINLVEAALLRARVGQVFRCVVVEVHEGVGGVVQLAEPAVLARCDGHLQLGTTVDVRLEQADLQTRSVRFRLINSKRQ